MRRSISKFIGLSFLLTATAFAQFGAPTIIAFPGAPTGSCGLFNLAVNNTISTANLYSCGQNGSWIGPYVTSTGGNPAFSAITNGTNTGAAMTVGTGASLSTSGTGTIAATSVANTGAVSTNASFFPLFVANNTSGNQATNTTAAFNFNPSTGALSATSFNGAGVFSTLSASGNLTTNITGATQCVHVNSSGVASGTGSDCGSGGATAESSITAPTAANTITETAAGDYTVRAGVETSNLTAPWVVKNTNSTNNNTSVGFMFGAAGTSTGGIAGLGFDVSGTGDIFDLYSGGSVSGATYTAGTLEAHIDHSGNASFAGGIATGGSTLPTCTGCLSDSNGNKELGLVATASAVDAWQMTNSATGTPGLVKLQTVGTDNGVSGQISAQDASANSVLGAMTLRGGNETGAGGSSSAGGPVLIAGGSNAATNTASNAGSVEILAGPSTGSSSTGLQGLSLYVASYAQSGTVTQWNLECSTSTAKAVTDCGATPTSIVGVALSKSSTIQVSVAGVGSEIPINASAAVTIGDTVCAGSTAGKVTDSGGTGSCAAGTTTVGVVIATSGTWPAFPDGTAFPTLSTSLPLVRITGLQATASGGGGSSFTNVGAGTPMWYPYFLTPPQGGNNPVNVVTALQPQLYAYYQPYTAAATKIYAWIVTGGASTFADVGLYGPVSGSTASLLWHTGSQSTASSGALLTGTITTTTTSAGVYYVAFCETSNTVTFASGAFAGTFVNNVVAGTPAAHTFGADATDTCTSGTAVLPSTITIANITNATTQYPIAVGVQP